MKPVSPFPYLSKSIADSNMIRKTIIFLIYILCFDINCLCIEPSTDRITKDSTIVHIVRKGETVYSIAREHHLTVDHILSCHPELKEGTLCEDDTLEFPCIASSSTKATDPYTTMSPTVNGSLDGYNYVDLGLQSGLKWATCNIGTANPCLHGNYWSSSLFEENEDIACSLYFREYEACWLNDRRDNGFPVRAVLAKHLPFLKSAVHPFF